jgi:hypothetical protein
MNLWKVSTVTLAIALGLVVGGSAVRSAQAEPQPHMRAALTALETAKVQLEKATPDKGGHRVKAIELTNAAMTEVKLGIEYDNTH